MFLPSVLAGLHLLYNTDFETQLSKYYECISLMDTFYFGDMQTRPFFTFQVALF